MRTYNLKKWQISICTYDFSKLSFSDEKGTLNFGSNGNNSLSNTNNLRTTLVNNIDYQTSGKVFKNGFVNNFGFYFKNLNSTGKNDDKYKSSIQTELLNINEFSSKLPLFKEDANYTNYITPKISFRMNPSDMKIIHLHLEQLQKIFLISID